jgi:Tfp pilus assembly protein PilO
MTRTNKILIVVVALAGSVCAFYFLALAPKREQIATLDGQIATKQAELDQVRQTLATYESAKASYEANYAKLARVGKAIPADDDVRSLLVQLESAADRTDVDFQNIELGSGLAGESGATATDPAATGAAAPGEGLASAPGTVPFAGGTMSAMPFSFTFNGGFFDLSNFLARLERFVTVSNDEINVHGRLLRLESLQLEPSPAGFPQMQAQIGAATYIVPPTEAVADGAAPDAQQAAGTDPGTPDDGSTPSTNTATVSGAAQ